MKITFKFGSFIQSNFCLFRQFVLSIVSIKLLSFIFEISQNYIIVFLTVIGRKHVRKIGQFFTCKHKINKSYAKVPTYYWIVCLYSKNVRFHVFIFNKFFNLFENIFNTKTIAINNFILVTKQSNPMCAYTCIFIKVYYVCPILYF